MRVLVTGHHGYIGSVTGRFLCDAGHEVVGLDTYLYRGCDLPGVPAGQPYPEVALDVRDIRPDTLRGFDAVVHLAALSNDPLGALDPALTEEINLGGTIRAAEAAKAAGVERFVFASSCSMYGAAGSDAGVDERAELQPLTAYARSKVQAEEALADLADDGFSPTSMRNATAYGVSPRPRLDVVLNNLTAWACTTGEIRILSDGTPWRPVVHVEDIARSTLAILEAPRERVHGEAFNVGREEDNYQVRDLAELVRAAVPGCRVEYAGTGDPDPRSYRVSFAKLRGALPGLELGWTAARGAEELAAAFRKAGLTLDQFEGDRYVRLRRLQRLLDARELGASLRWTDGAVAVAGP
jgi:nucleoside-diphosphate-sugar epimerase